MLIRMPPVVREGLCTAFARSARPKPARNLLLRLGFQRGDPLGEALGLFARLGGHRLDRVELLAGDESIPPIASFIRSRALSRASRVIPAKVPAAAFIILTKSETRGFSLCLGLMWARGRAGSSAGSRPELDPLHRAAHLHPVDLRVVFVVLSVVFGGVVVPRL